MQILGHHASARLIDKRTVPANESVAEHLGIPAGSLVVKIQRVRLADHTPLSFDEHIYLERSAKRSLKMTWEMEPIFSLLEEKYTIPLVEAEYHMEAALATPEVARALGISAGGPVFLIERTSFCEGHKPIDYERLHYRGDHISFVTRLARRPRPKPRTETVSNE